MRDRFGVVFFLDNAYYLSRGAARLSTAGTICNADEIGLKIGKLVQRIVDRFNRAVLGGNISNEKTV